jgi:serine/threonine-protein kinase
MAVSPRVLELLEEMLDSGKTPDVVCRDCPELLPEVRERWKKFHLIDAAVAALVPGLRTTRADGGMSTRLSAADLPQVPGYEVQGLLGYGGMGVVYKARQCALDRVVALKTLPIGPFTSPQELQRFQRETAALASLRHPNIIQVFDAGDADGRPYFSMEFVEGGSLSRKLEGTPLPAHQAVELLVTLAGAMQVAHEVGIVHRDLKPSNVLLTADGTPKISDFGLARRMEGEDGLTRSGAAVGTPSYMAPEQAESKTVAIGPAVDVYALGAILYECLTGRPPFRAESDLATVYQVVTREPVPPSQLNHSVPRDLETICLKCLHKQPPRRYVSAAALAEDLNRFGRGDPIAARPTGRWERLARRVRRRPAAAGLLVAIVLLMLVLGVGAGIQYRQWSTARDHQAETDRRVSEVLSSARGPLDEGWQEQDQAKISLALSEANRAVDIARSGAASASVRQEAETFRVDADERLSRAKKNDTLREAVLDVTTSQEAGIYTRDEAGLKATPASPSVDEQYATAFRRWGVDVNGTAEAEVVARIGAEPDAVVAELIAALDEWMMERLRAKRPEAEWRRLFLVAEQLDRSERRRWLRTLLVGESPPRVASVAGLVGTGLFWPSLWELARGSDLRQLQEVRREVDTRAAPVLTVVLLSQAYYAVGDAAGAEEILREAVTARPDQALLLDALGKLLMLRGPPRLGNAIENFRAARALRPRMGIVFSRALLHANRAKEAEGVLRDLLRHQQETTTLINHLGVCLDAQHKYAEAEVAYRKAIDLTPDFAEAHNNLGLCLGDQQRHEEAERAVRKAIDLRPNWPVAYYNLGNTLAAQNKQAKAAEAFHKAIDLRPDWAEAYYNLGNAQAKQGVPGAAEVAYRKAIALRPGFALAHNNLGMALGQQQKPGAEAAFRKAIALQGDYFMAYNNLGTILGQQRKYAEAEAAYRKAVALRPDFPLAHFNLAQVLLQQAQFDEALAFVNKGNDLLPLGDPLRAQARPLLQECQQYVALDTRLPAILRGVDKPANATEQIGFAKVCVLKKRFATAARFYGDAFVADPKIAAAVPAGIRYNAACAAALAGCGRGMDADQLDDTKCARMRQQALDWLRQDLTWWSKALDNGTIQTHSQVQQHLRHWQIDDDLAGLRELDALQALSPEERKKYLELWKDVATVLNRVNATSRSP